MDVRRAQFDGVLQNLVDEADDRSLVLGGLVEIGVLGIFVNDLETFFLVERADGVRADAEAFFDFALDGFAGGEDRPEVQAGGRRGDAGFGVRRGSLRADLVRDVARPAPRGRAPARRDPPGRLAVDDLGGLALARRALDHDLVAAGFLRGVERRVGPGDEPLERRALEPGLVDGDPGRNRDRPRSSGQPLALYSAARNGLPLGNRYA